MRHLKSLGHIWPHLCLVFFLFKKYNKQKQKTLFGKFVFVFGNLKTFGEKEGALETLKKKFHAVSKTNLSRSH